MHKSLDMLMSTGSSLLITQKSSLEPHTRFERNVYSLTEGEDRRYIKVRFDKLIPAEYGLAKRRALYFFPDTVRWRGIVNPDEGFDTDEQLLFKVEIIGMLYLKQPDVFEAFGLSISGFDIRHLFFSTFFRVHGLPNILPDKTAVRFVDIKGDELRVFAKEVLNKWYDLFTIEEQLMIAKYLKQD